jgi:hypothetical protein
VRVVAIGGSASVGKTTCAAGVARILGVTRIVHVDDLSADLQRAGQRHFLDTIDQPWSQPPVDLAKGLLGWTARLHPLILAAVDDLAVTGGVIEGEGIDPRFASHVGRGVVSTVYVIESDPDRLRATFLARPSRDRFSVLSSEEQKSVVEMNRLYGEWLRSTATKVGEPWVPAQPWESLPERIVDVIVDRSAPSPGRRASTSTPGHGLGGR